MIPAESSPRREVRVLQNVVRGLGYEPMRGWILLTGLCGAVGIAGCGAPLAPASHASLRLVADLGPAARTLQAAVTPYTRADVASLAIRLYWLDGASESEVAARTLLPAELDGTVSFTSLRPFRTYRVRGFAYQADGGLISETARSYLDVTVAGDETATAGTLPVYLLDRLFSGQASSAPIAVTDGGLVPAGIETLGLLGPRGRGLATREAAEGTPWHR